MSIKATDITSIIIDEENDVNIMTLNKSIVRLLSNDLELCQQDAYTPQIWECKWFNNTEISGYPKGYCVWYNTEDPDEFVQSNKGKILRYVYNNALLKNIYDDLSGVKKDTFLKEVISGYYDKTTGISCDTLFDIGNLSAPAAIYISLSDNNRERIFVNNKLNSKYWTQFTINDAKNTFLNNLLCSHISNMLSTHVQLYHMGNSTTSSYIDTFARKDLTNITNLQKFGSHEFQISTSGFDYVKLFVKQPFSLSARYVNSVAKEKYKKVYWKLASKDKYTTNGIFTLEGSNLARSVLEGCNNYLSDNINIVLNDLIGQYKTISDITYTANKSIYAVPVTTKDFSEIQNRISAYNATFKIVPISTELSSNISSIIDQYVMKEEDVQVNYASVRYSFNRWFRQWNSGYLEHGGIVPIQRNAVSVIVNFDWKYKKDGVEKTAPIYDYPQSSTSFYGYHDTFDEERKLDSNIDLNLKRNRYVVNITPVVNNYKNALFGDDVGYATMPDKNGIYVSNEVTHMKNDSFTIITYPHDDVQFISYYVSGYKEIIQKDI